MNFRTAAAVLAFALAVSSCSTISRINPFSADSVAQRYRYSLGPSPSLSDAIEYSNLVKTAYIRKAGRGASFDPLYAQSASAVSCVAAIYSALNQFDLRNFATNLANLGIAIDDLSQIYGALSSLEDTVELDDSRSYYRFVEAAQDNLADALQIYQRGRVLDLYVSKTGFHLVTAVDNIVNKTAQASRAYPQYKYDFDSIIEQNAPSLTSSGEFTRLQVQLGFSSTTKSNAEETLRSANTMLSSVTRLANYVGNEISTAVHSQRIIREGSACRQEQIAQIGIKTIPSLDDEFFDVIAGEEFKFIILNESGTLFANWVETPPPAGSKLTLEPKGQNVVATIFVPAETDQDYAFAIGREDGTVVLVDVYVESPFDQAEMQDPDSADPIITITNRRSGRSEAYLERLVDLVKQEGAIEPLDAFSRDAETARGFYQSYRDEDFFLEDVKLLVDERLIECDFALGACAATSLGERVNRRIENEN